MVIKSKFSLWTFLPIGLLLLVTGSLAFVIQSLFYTPNTPSFRIIVFIMFFAFTWVWLVFGELRTKIVKVEVEGNQISVANYFGIGSKKVFSFSQFEGLQTAILPSRYYTYEYLYLIKDNKKAIKLSQFYHSNYAELKSALTDKVRDLGQQRYSLIQDIQEIFI